MTVTCTLFGPLRDRAGEKEVELSIDRPVAVRTILHQLVDTHPDLEEALFDEDGALHPINVTVGGTNIQQADGLDTQVEDESTVRLAPPVTGGSTLLRDGTER